MKRYIEIRIGLQIYGRCTLIMCFMSKLEVMVVELGVEYTVQPLRETPSLGSVLRAKVAREDIAESGRVP